MYYNENNYLYIIYDCKNKTYNGYTNNINRRIRQHNKEICGGAKYTTSKVNDSNKWKYLLYISCVDNEIFDRKKALSMEWSIKYPTNKKPRPRVYCSPLGRIKSLPLVFSNPKFSCFNFNVHVSKECPYMNEIKNNLEYIDNVYVFIE